MSIIWGFDHMEDKHTLYCGKHCMKKFSESLRENAKSVTDFENKKILPLTRKELKSHEDVEKCYICGKRFFKKLFRDKNYRKVRDHCHYPCKYRGAVHCNCNLKFNVPNETPVVFHNNSNFDYHFIIKELPKSLKEYLNVLGKTKKSIKLFCSNKKGSFKN